MARKVFVSYKHSDTDVYPIEEGKTARAYVDKLIAEFERVGDTIYKGEGNEDLSGFKDETIKDRLKDKIHNSSITLVLISSNMMENKPKLESDQWIPWEISYSLKEITRNDRTSHTNAIIAVVLPDRSNLYKYFIKDYTHCNCRIIETPILFKILRKNMLNIKKPEFTSCEHHPPPNRFYKGDSSYIISVKWKDFISNKVKYYKNAEKIRDDRNSYNITKEIE